MSGIENFILAKAEGETTFMYDDALLDLPVPDLSYTLGKYLESVRPHVSDEEFKNTEALARQFLNGDGQTLQRKLQEKAANERSWLDKWWEDVAYLELRLPAPLMNMAGPGPYIEDVWPAKPGTQIPRTALALHFTLKFWLFLRKEQYRPMKDGKGRPVCMYQFRRIFNTANIPGVHKDKLIEYFKTEREGPCPSHVTVTSKGHTFILNPFDEAGEPLTPPELEAQLQRIKDRSIALGPAQGVNFLSSQERTTWAQNRNYIASIHPNNYAALEKIQESILSIWLEDGNPTDISDLANHSLLGSGENRWLDKSLSSGFYENGLSVSNADHTPAEGILMVFITSYVHAKLKEIDGVWQGSKTVRPQPEPEHIEFYLDEKLKAGIDIARKGYLDMQKMATAHVGIYKKYGKNFCKQKRIHPDTYCQMAMQLAYYKIYRKMAPTYETAPIKQFYHGRTETMRTCTNEAKAWCESMMDASVPSSQKYQLFMAAVDKHNKDYAEACEFKACDRHLLGLYLIAREENLPIPPLFADPSFVKSGGGGNFILSTSCIGYTSVLGAVLPMCENCIGCFYRINDDKLVFYVTTWNADKATSSPGFAEACCQSLDMMRDLIDKEWTAPSKL